MIHSKEELQEFAQAVLAEQVQQGGIENKSNRMAYDHLLIKCSCGAVINQCRCAFPDKPIEIALRGCEACKNPYKTNEESPAFRALWLEALACQNACNLSGLVHSFSKVMEKLWQIDRQNQNIGTIWVNSNSVTRLWTCKLSSLSGLDTSSDWTVPEL